MFLGVNVYPEHICGVLKMKTLAVCYEIFSALLDGSSMLCYLSPNTPGPNPFAALIMGNLSV